MYIEEEEVQIIPFTISELSFSVAGMLASLSALLLVVWKSRCKKINCCYGCIKCDRDISLRDMQEHDIDIEMQKIPKPKPTQEARL